MGWNFFGGGSSKKETSANTRSDRDGSTPNGGGMTTGRGGWGESTPLGADAAVGGMTWNRGQDSAGSFDRSSGDGFTGGGSGTGSQGNDDRFTWGAGRSGGDGWGWGGGTGGSSGSGDTWGTPGRDPWGNPSRDPYGSN